MRLSKDDRRTMSNALLTGMIVIVVISVAYLIENVYHPLDNLENYPPTFPDVTLQDDDSVWCAEHDDYCYEQIDGKWVMFDNRNWQCIEWEEIEIEKPSTTNITAFEWIKLLDESSFISVDWDELDRYYNDREELERDFKEEKISITTYINTTSNVCVKEGLNCYEESYALWCDGETIKIPSCEIEHGRLPNCETRTVCEQEREYGSQTLRGGDVLNVEWNPNRCDDIGYQSMMNGCYDYWR